jgi:putative membrane protein
MDKLTGRFVLFFKGMAMGAADVVPGVSGGTIAFITGIYEKLINSIRSVDLTALQMVLKGQFGAAWKHFNGNFLLVLIAGIGTSVLSLSRLVLWLLDNQPILLWSFFFGLILASIWSVGRNIEKFQRGRISMFVIGAAIAFWITRAAPANTPESWWFVLLSGGLAICAMILPGISGSFILLLLGKYKFILGAIKAFNLQVIAFFGIGMVGGILAFSHLLNWLLKRYHDLTVALLAGFMLGSLNKVWPWKIPVAVYTDSHGKMQPLVERNLMPWNYEAITGHASELGIAVLLMVVGMVAVVLLDNLGRRTSE